MEPERTAKMKVKLSTERYRCSPAWMGRLRRIMSLTRSISLISMANWQAQTLEVAVRTGGLDEAMVAGNIVGIARHIPSHLKSRAIVLDGGWQRKLLNLLLNKNLSNNFPGAGKNGPATEDLVAQGVGDEQGNFRYHAIVVTIMAGRLRE